MPEHHRKPNTDAPVPYIKWHREETLLSDNDLVNLCQRHLEHTVISFEGG